MPTVEVADHELHYVRRGSGEPLLLIMGMSGNHLHWGEPFLELLERDFDVVAYDHRGMGLSGAAVAGFSIADLADDAAGVLDALGWESAHVVGISMGGMVAQELVLRHPERVRTLVLGCTMAGGAESTTTAPEVIQRLTEAMLSGDRERAIRTGWGANVSAAYAADEANWERFRETAEKHPAPVPMILAQVQAIAGHDTVDRLHQVRVPTLVIHGTDDEMLSVANAAVIAERIPGARLEIYEGVGHLFFWEEPERSAGLVRELALGARTAP